MSDPQTGPAIMKFGFLAVAALAIAAGLYAFFAPTGNPVSVAGGQCALNEATRTALNNAATGEVAAFQVVDQPSSVASLSFNDKDGKPTSLAAWEGRTVLLNLWATWCAPCRQEMPGFLRSTQGRGRTRCFCHSNI